MNYNDIIKDNRFLCIKFTASWCSPCKKIEPFFDEMKSTHPWCSYLTLDIDAYPNICIKEGIFSIPTFLFYYNEQRLDNFTVLGAKKEILTKNISLLKTFYEEHYSKNITMVNQDSKEVKEIKTIDLLPSDIKKHDSHVLPITDRR